MDLARARITELEESTVLQIVTWYVANGGTPGPERIMLVFGERAAVYSPWETRDRIGVLLAEAKPRIPAGNPFRDDATITCVERWAIAEAAYRDACRWAGLLLAVQAVGVCEVRSDLEEAMADCNVWHVMRQRYRAHPYWQETMTGLRREFGRLVYGDPERGLHGDASFLAYIGVG